MEFTCETVCGPKAAAVMAGVLRKTIRKKRSRRSHVFGWIAVVLAVLVTLPLGGRGFSLGFRTAVTWLAALAIVLVLLFEDRLNGYAARRRMLAGTDRVVTVFTEESYTSSSAVGTTEFRYETAALLAETADYFVFVFDPSHAQIYDKHTLSGGTAEEFRSFLARKTGKTISRVDL